MASPPNIHTNNLDNNELIQIPAAKPKKNIMNKLRTKIASIPCKPKIALCCCGFAPRSFKYTYKSIENNIINVLKDDFELDVYIYSFTSESNTLESKNEFEDGKQINNSDVNLIKDAKVFTRNQEEEIKTIQEIIKTNQIKTRNINIVNFIRQLLMLKYSYMEILNISNKYKSIIYVEPDMYICKPISRMEIHNTILKSNNIYTTSFNDWNGYGSGFYIGSMNAMNIICNMVTELSNDIGTDNEKLVFNVIDNSPLKRVKSNMFYFKVYHGGKPNVYYQLLQKNTNTEEFMWVMDNFNKKSEKSNKSKVRKKHKRRSCPM